MGNLHRHTAKGQELKRHRYKGYATSVIDKEGTLDRNEFYNVRCVLSHN